MWNWLVSVLANKASIVLFDGLPMLKKKDDLLKSLNEIVKDGDKVLVKGSRGMRMETIVERMLI